MLAHRRFLHKVYTENGQIPTISGRYELKTKSITQLFCLLFACSLLLVPATKAEVTEIYPNQTLTDLSGEKEYYKYTLPYFTDFVQVILRPEFFVDYDLYVCWRPDTIPQAIDAGDPVDDFDAAPKFGQGSLEMCVTYDLRPGTYYVMVHWSGNRVGTYNLTLTYEKWSDYIFEDPKRSARLKVGVEEMIFAFSAPGFTWNFVKVQANACMSFKHDLISIKGYVYRIYPDGSREEIFRIKAMANTRMHFAYAHVVALDTGQKYLLIDRPNHGT